MKTIIKSILIIVLGTTTVMAQVLSPASKQTVEIVLKDGTIHDGNLNVIENASILIREGKINQIGTWDELDYAENARVIELNGKHIYPGLILPMSQLGLAEIGSVSATVDSREIGSLNPNVRSIVAYNTDSEHIPVIRSNGVLVAQIIPSGGLISGSSSIVQLDAWNWEDAILVQDIAIHLNWPSKSHYSRRSGTRSVNKEYGKQIESLKEIFDNALAYSKIEKPEDTNLKLEALAGLFNGSKKLFINASDPEQIIEAVNFAKKYEVKDIVLTGLDEKAWLVKDFIKENEVSVILDGMFSLPGKADDDVWLNSKLAVMFHKEGIKTALELRSAMNYAFNAGQSVAYGLSKEESLQLITKIPAEILGIDDKLGTIEVGKDATIVVSDGDILDIVTNNIVYAFINGRNINLDNRHKHLYRKFKAKYEANE